jgi:hypothetical protein
MNEIDYIATLARPEERDGWLRPSSRFPAEPRWGHPDGIQVGLHPLSGPRGLLRVYAPYLGHPRDRLVNFIAVEPIPAGEAERGFSELERSILDGVQGKRFWSADSPEDATPRPADQPARGTIDTVDGVEHLRVFILVEPFDNGADVYVRISFRADRPHELGLAAWRREESVELDHCILTATMGNYARLRRLRLADAIVTPDALWPGFEGPDFTEHGRFPLARLDRTAQGDAIVSATPDEDDPASAAYAPGTAEHWKYSGLRARQTWRAPEPDAALEARVNGRHAYWMSASPIPGGTAYENVELVEPFRQGRELFFGIEPLTATT